LYSYGPIITSIFFLFYKPNGIITQHFNLGLKAFAYFHEYSISLKDFDGSICGGETKLEYVVYRQISF